MFIAFAQGVALLLALCAIQGVILYRWRRDDRTGQIAAGLAYGGICIFGMMTPIVLAPGVIFDARSVILAIAGLFGGPLPAGIAAVLAAGYRTWLGGAGAEIGVAVILTSTCFGLAYREMVRRGWVQIRGEELLAFGFLVHLAEIGFFQFFPAPIATAVMHKIALPMIVTFTPATAVLGLFMKMVEERIDNQRSLEETDFRFRQIADNVREAFFIASPDRDEVLYISPAYEEIWGRDRESLYRAPLSYLDPVHPEDRERVRNTIFENKYAEYDQSYRIVRPDGTIRNVKVHAYPVRNDAGDVYRVVGIAEDITEIEERDARLRQAQKMEAIGQLTGGIAHDFNNLLQVIQGNADILEEKVGRTDTALDAIQRASNRGAELTQRLLAFARRQPLKAEAVDVGALIRRLVSLLDRTLGGNVRITTDTEPDLWPALVDAGQLENALLNLAINARDAMGGDGAIEIRAARTTIPLQNAAAGEEGPAPGDYVSIVVRDNGPGMSEKVRARAFEPFFTTKRVGQGSGLGLSMVYGFAKQSAGNVSIDSAEGGGTSITLYLPRARDVAGAGETALPEEQETAAPGRKVLIVEDDPDVRALAVTIVSSLGYRTADAGTAEEAMAVIAAARDGDPIDCLLCDVMIPGKINGPDLAHEAKKQLPDLAIVFVSGYPQGLDRDGDRDTDRNVLIPKPFGKNDVAEALSRAFAPRSPKSD